MQAGSSRGSGNLDHWPSMILTRSEALLKMIMMIICSWWHPMHKNILPFFILAVGTIWSCWKDSHGLGLSLEGPIVLKFFYIKSRDLSRPSSTSTPWMKLLCPQWPCPHVSIVIQKAHVRFSCEWTNTPRENVTTSIFWQLQITTCLLFYK